MQAAHQCILIAGKAWQRKVLQDLTEQTHFSSTELQVLLNHFTDLQSSDDHLDKDTFFKCLGQGEPLRLACTLRHAPSNPFWVGRHSEGCLPECLSNHVPMWKFVDHDVCMRLMTCCGVGMHS